MIDMSWWTCHGGHVMVGVVSVVGHDQTQVIDMSWWTCDGGHVMVDM